MSAIDDDGREVARTLSPDLQDVHHLGLKALLLLVWAAVSFGVCFFARDLVWVVAGWPLGYWIASQGAVLVFIVIVAAYAWAMGRFERQEAAVAQAAQPALPPDASHG